MSPTSPTLPSADAPMLSGLFSFLNSKPRATRLALVTAAAVVAVVAVTVGAVVGLTDQAAFVGSPAGLTLFAALLAWRETLASEQARTRTDLKAKMPLPRRRFFVGVTSAIFAIVVLLVGAHVPQVVAGTVVVFVVAALVTAFRAAPAEAAAAPSPPESL